MSSQTLPTSRTAIRECRIEDEKIHNTENDRTSFGSVLTLHHKEICGVAGFDTVSVNFIQRRESGRIIHAHIAGMERCRKLSVAGSSIAEDYDEIHATFLDNLKITFQGEKGNKLVSVFFPDDCTEP